MSIAAPLQAQNKIQLIPDWTIPKGIALVYPEKLPESPSEKIKKKDLIEFYDNFIKNIIDNAEISEVTIVHRIGLKEKLTKLFPSTKIKLVQINSVQDIWIRDYAPIATTTNHNSIKASYNPLYFQKNEKLYAQQDDTVGRVLAEKYLNMKITDLVCNSNKVILDGGNFIHNGNGIGITTNRIIADNEWLSIDEIHNTFKEQLGISKLIIIPVEPGDETGHIDGMVRFINETTIVVAAYTEHYKEGKDFMDGIAKQLVKDFKVIRITNETPQDQNAMEFPSAYGNYINFLRVGNKIFLPQYGITAKDQNAKEQYEKYFKVITVDKDIEKLSKLGGVLNCITWTYY